MDDILSLWKDMPEFEQDSIEPYHTVKVHFPDEESIAEFSKLIKQTVTNKTKYIWFPKQKRLNLKLYACVGGEEYHPQYPVYIVSKGRWEYNYTAKVLWRMKIRNFYIVIEEQEYKMYARNVPQHLLLVMDKRYKEQYEVCDEFGNEIPVGSGAARNFAWDHSVSNGYSHHWVLDDNITDFYYLNRNIKYRCYTPAIFYAIEDFVNRFENVAIAGMNYEKFVPRKQKHNPFTLNVHVYSCMLINNSIPFRWRCRLNEDVDLCIRVLKAGYCTILFNCFLAGKLTTQVLKGGNTDTFYRKQGTLHKSQMLARMHPDVVKLVWRYGRWHHHVNWDTFKSNQLKYKSAIAIADRINMFGMKLVRITEKEYEKLNDMSDWDALIQKNK